MLEDYINYAINCITKEQQEELFEILEQKGYEWNSGSPLSDKNYWEKHKKYTCYVIKDNHAISYGGYEFYEHNHYKIIEFEDFKRSILPQEAVPNIFSYLDSDI